MTSMTERIVDKESFVDGLSLMRYLPMNHLKKVRIYSDMNLIPMYYESNSLLL